MHRPARLRATPQGSFKAARAMLMLGALALLPAPLALADNTCDEPGDFPDVIVSELFETRTWGTLGDITAFSVGTRSCNIGTCELRWFAETNEHPVIGGNMYRLKDGRFEHLGQSWLKHGFFALSENTCGSCQGTDGSTLGVACSDPYTANLNGSQSRLGPKFEVNPSTGIYPFPATDLDETGDVLYKRLQVHNDDIELSMNPGARYFVEGQYVTADDARSFSTNNASHREVTVSPGPNYDLSFVAPTVEQEPAIMAWKHADPSVNELVVDVFREGRFIISAKVTDLGNGTWDYEYAIQNLNIKVAIGSFRVPIPLGSVITDIGFHDVDYHSGEPYDGTDWTPTDPAGATALQWSTVPFATDPNANALRWGTLYNFRFRADAPPTTTTATLRLFESDAPLSLETLGPEVCDNDGTCENGENCDNCPADCPTTVVVAECGDGICTPAAGEDCLNCSLDCAGQTGGPQADRYCCGDLTSGAINPVDCSDSRCTSGGFECGDVAPGSCCGDLVCAPDEDSCACGVDCGLPPQEELVCDDTLDDDCDGLTDCADDDCCDLGPCAGGADNDGDQVAACDCDDNNGLVWGTPGATQALIVDKAGTDAVLTWAPPIEPGGTAPDYEVLRSFDPTDFGGKTVCIPLADPSVPATDDAAIPSLGTFYAYLPRAVNACPTGDGPLGTDSGGQQRSGVDCP